MSRQQAEGLGSFLFNERKIIETKAGITIGVFQFLNDGHIVNLKNTFSRFIEHEYPK